MEESNRKTLVEIEEEEIKIVYQLAKAERNKRLSLIQPEPITYYERKF